MKKELFPVKETPSVETFHPKSFNQSLADRHPKIFNSFLKTFFQGEHEQSLVYKDAFSECYDGVSKSLKTLIQEDPRWDDSVSSREDLLEACENIFILIKIFERHHSTNLQRSPIELTPIEIRAIYTLEKTFFFFPAISQALEISEEDPAFIIKTFFQNFLNSKCQHHREYAAKLYQCKPEEVSTTPEEFFKGSKVHVGNLTITEDVLTRVFQDLDSAPLENLEKNLADVYLGDVYFSCNSMESLFRDENIENLLNSIFQNKTFYGSVTIFPHSANARNIGFRKGLSCTVFGSKIVLYSGVYFSQQLSLSGLCQHIDLDGVHAYYGYHHEFNPNDSLSLNLKNISTHNLRLHRGFDISGIRSVTFPQKITSTVVLSHDYLNNLPPSTDLTIVYTQGESPKNPLTIPEEVTQFTALQITNLDNIALPQNLERLCLSITSAKRVLFPPHLKILDLYHLDTFEGLLLPPHAQLVYNEPMRKELEEAMKGGRDILQECRDAWLEEYQRTRFHGVFPPEEGTLPKSIPLLMPTPPEEPSVVKRIVTSAKNLWNRFFREKK